MQRERRFYQRYPVDFQVQITVNALTFTNSSINISGGGIQVECSGECVEQLNNCPTIPATCQITMTLPNSNKSLELKCRLIVKRRLSQLRYVLGLKFIEINEVDRQNLMARIKTLSTSSANESPST